MNLVPSSLTPSMPAGLMPASLAFTPAASQFDAADGSTLCLIPAPTYISLGDPSLPAVPQICGIGWRGYVFVQSNFQTEWTVVSGPSGPDFPDFETAFNFAQEAATEAWQSAEQNCDEFVTRVGWTVVQESDPNGPLCNTPNSGCASGFQYDPLSMSCRPACPSGFNINLNSDEIVCTPQIPFIPPPPPCQPCPAGEYCGNFDTDNGCLPGDELDPNFTFDNCDECYCCVPSLPPPPPPPPPPNDCSSNQVLDCDGVTPVSETDPPCGSNQIYDRQTGCCRPCCCSVNQVKV